MDDCNLLIDPDYIHSDWYIAPKYNSFKQEIINPEKHASLNVMQYESTLKRAGFEHQAIGHKIKGAHWW